MTIAVIYMAVTIVKTFIRMTNIRIRFTIDPFIICKIFVILHLLQFFNSLEDLLLKGNTSFKNYRLINNMTIMQKKLQNILRITVTKTFLIT